VPAHRLPIPATTSLEGRIAALEKIIPQAVNDLIYRDSHMWSDRPCGTCKTVSSLIGQPFGCERRAAEKRKSMGN